MCTNKSCSLTAAHRASRGPATMAPTAPSAAMAGQAASSVGRTRSIGHDGGRGNPDFSSLYSARMLLE